MQQKKPLKPKSCRVCKSKFVPRSSTQSVCSPLCAYEKAVADRKTKERKEYRVKKEALKTRKEWLNEAQAIFNKWVRLRDKNLPCVSCGAIEASWDAGHYRSVGAAPGLRFNPDNVHKQCVHCNQHKSGNAIEYRIGLCNRIGAERVEALEQNNEIIKWTIEDAKQKKAEYRVKIKELESV